MKIIIWLSLLINANSSAIAHPGVGIIMDSKGNVFYTDTESVLKIDVSGRKSVVISNVHTHELFLDANDNLFGEHLWYNNSNDTWGHYVTQRLGG
jgi:hypothetical protein